MSDKTWLSEYTDRSEPTRETPRDIAERLGVPLVGGSQDRIIQETPVHKPVGVCAKCGIAIYSSMNYVCHTEGCPTGLGGTSFMNADGNGGIDG